MGVEKEEKFGGREGGEGWVHRMRRRLWIKNEEKVVGRKREDGWG